jgi:hypothetical protein
MEPEGPFVWPKESTTGPYAVDESNPHPYFLII